MLLFQAIFYLEAGWRLNLSINANNIPAEKKPEKLARILRVYKVEKS
jgi:hypothetical protein